MCSHLNGHVATHILSRHHVPARCYDLDLDTHSGCPTLYSIQALQLRMHLPETRFFVFLFLCYDLVQRYQGVGCRGTLSDDDSVDRAVAEVFVDPDLERRYVATYQ